MQCDALAGRALRGEGSLPLRDTLPATPSFAGLDEVRAADECKQQCSDNFIRDKQASISPGR